ncbi:MAG: 4-(cytidine 5'-diphospho)-2-C-methyl-D-erythritol kinase [Flavobacteriales bacterium]
MIVFPHAKINLGLNVVRKRTDGYHDIETVMVPIPLCDALEAVVDAAIAPGQAAFTRSGLPVNGPLEADLVMRAHALLGALRPLPGLRLHLHKAIPMGAGLGGGSSDGAHALLLLNKLLGLGIGAEELRGLALRLGSDCPFFLAQGPQLATGRGEVLLPVHPPLPGLWLLVVNPGVAVPTAEVYAHVRPTGTGLGLARVLLEEPVERWRALAPNIMEEHVFRTRPVVAAACQRLRDAGALHAAMSGSGSTVFGLFAAEPPAMDWPAGHAAWLFRL